MSVGTDSLLLDFVDPLKAALDLVKSERLNTEVARVLIPSLSREEIENFQRSMWQRDQVSRVIGQYLELAAALPPPAMIYVETADGERVGFAGERLLDDARLVGMPGNLVLCIDGGNYTVVDVSCAPLPDNRGLGGPPNPGSGFARPFSVPIQSGGLTRSSGAAPGGVAQGDALQTALDASPQSAPPGFGMVGAANAGSPSPVPGMVVNPDFVRWREMATSWQQERLKRQREFLAACDMIRRDAFEIDIEAGSTVAVDEQTEPIDDRPNRPGTTSGSAPPTVVASYLAEGKKIGGHVRVQAPYLAWLRAQSQPPSYKDRLDKLKALAQATGWPTPSGPVRSTLREWEKELRQEFLRETNQPDRPLSD
jgi:hypothetical protein